ncbi:MAG: helix-turn-helix domain-containing protein [Atribacterota bacterium]
MQQSYLTFKETCNILGKSKRTVSRYIKKGLLNPKKVRGQKGIEYRFNTHTLRKTWGYHSRKNFGIPIELISEKLGHSSNAVTKRYIGISQEEINNIEKKVCL